MLELRDTELELLVLGTEHEAELAEDGMQARARAFGHACRIPAPAPRQVVDRAPRVVAAHAAALGERVRELLDTLGCQGHRADGSQDELLEPVPGLLVSGRGHGASTAGAAGGVRVSHRSTRRRAARPSQRAPASGPKPARRPRSPWRSPPPRRRPRPQETPCPRRAGARTPARAPSTLPGAAPR